MASPWSPSAHASVLAMACPPPNRAPWFSAAPLMPSFPRWLLGQGLGGRPGAASWDSGAQAAGWGGGSGGKGVLASACCGVTVTLPPGPVSSVAATLLQPGVSRPLAAGLSAAPPSGLPCKPPLGAALCVLTLGTDLSSHPQLCLCCSARPCVSPLPTPGSPQGEHRAVSLSPGSGGSRV